MKNGAVSGYKHGDMVCFTRKIAFLTLLGIFWPIQAGIAAQSDLSKLISADRFYAKEKTLQGAMAGLNQACEIELNRALNEYKRSQGPSPSLKKMRVKKGTKKSQKKVKAKYENRTKRIQSLCKKARLDLDQYYAPKNASPKSRPKSNDRNLTPSETYSTDLSDLKDRCDQDIRAAQNRFHRVRKQIDRSLGSMRRSESDKRRRIKKARNKLAKELKRINKECRGDKRALIKEYRKRQSEYTPPKRKTVKKKKIIKPKSKKVVKDEAKQKIDWVSVKDNIRLSGSLKQEVAMRLAGTRELTKNRSQLSLRQKVSITDNLNLRLSERAYYDGVFDQTDNYPSNVEDDQELLLEIRDAYIDYSRGNFDFRIGNQQIVWGETVGLFIADVVNGKDLREYILQDFNQIRLHQPSIEITHSIGALSKEIIVTHPRFNKIGEAGSEFEPPSPVPVGISFTQDVLDEPSVSAENLEMGGRVSYLFGGLDVGAFYLYGWNKFPVYYRTIGLSGFRLHPDYERQNNFGFTFSKDISEAILKGEMVYLPRHHVSIADPTDVDGVVRRDVVNYVLGVDYTFWNDYETNTQFIQQRVSGDDQMLINAEAIQSFGTFWVKTTIWDGNIEPEILFIASLGDNDTLIRPKIGYRASDSVKITVGADFMDGDTSQGFFGIFKDRDRGYAELEWFF